MQGRVFWISLPMVGSSATSHTSPRATTRTPRHPRSETRPLPDDRRLTQPATGSHLPSPHALFSVAGAIPAHPLLPAYPLRPPVPVGSRSVSESVRHANCPSCGSSLSWRHLKQNVMRLKMRCKYNVGTF